MSLIDECYVTVCCPKCNREFSAAPNIATNTVRCILCGAEIPIENLNEFRNEIERANKSVKDFEK